MRKRIAFSVLVFQLFGVCLFAQVVVLPGNVLEIGGRVGLATLRRSTVADPFVGATFYVNTGSTAGGDGTSSATTGSTRAFASLREAVTHAGLDVSSARRILCAGTTADTNSVKQAHWDSLSSTPTEYVEIRGDNTTGIYNTSAYRIEVTNDSAIYNNHPGHVRIYNLQAKVRSTTSTGANYNGIRLSTQNVGAGRTDCDCRIVNCIVQVSMTGNDDAFAFINSDYETSSVLNKMRLINCIAYSTANSAGGFSYGFNSVWTGVANYNCTAYGLDFGFIDPQVTVNCLSSDCTYNDFEGVGTGGGVSDYNASSNGTAVGTHKRVNKIFTFVSVPGFDFHLSPSDANATDFGLSDPLSGLYSTDIDGQARGAAWSIGADEP